MEIAQMRLRRRHALIGRLLKQQKRCGVVFGKAATAVLVQHGKITSGETTALIGSQPVIMGGLHIIQGKSAAPFWYRKPRLFCAGAKP